MCVTWLILCVTWLIHTWHSPGYQWRSALICIVGMTRSCVWHNSFYAWRDSFTRKSSFGYHRRSVLMRRVDMTDVYVWHDSLKGVKWLILRDILVHDLLLDIREDLHSYVGQTWLMCTCDMTRAMCGRTHSHVNCSWITALICMVHMPRLYMSHDSCCMWHHSFIREILLDILDDLPSYI